MLFYIGETLSTTFTFVFTNKVKNKVKIVFFLIVVLERFEHAKKVDI